MKWGRAVWEGMARAGTSRQEGRALNLELAGSPDVSEVTGLRLAAEDGTDTEGQSLATCTILGEVNCWKEPALVDSRL